LTVVYGISQLRIINEKLAGGVAVAARIAMVADTNRRMNRLSRLAIQI
jgi:hypothetical protein